MQVELVRPLERHVPLDVPYAQGWMVTLDGPSTLGAQGYQRVIDGSSCGHLDPMLAQVAQESLGLPDVSLDVEVHSERTGMVIVFSTMLPALGVIRHSTS